MGREKGARMGRERDYVKDRQIKQPHNKSQVHNI